MPSLEELNQTPFTERVLVVCEGISDAYTFLALVNHRKLGGFAYRWPDPKKLGQPQGGLFSYPVFLNGLAGNSGYSNVETILVVADNDVLKDDNHKKVQEWLAAAGFPVPAEPRVFAKGADGRRIATIMLPETGKDGCLETLVMESWNRANAACLNDYSRCTGVDNWPVSRRDKALVRCILAATSKKDPERSLAYSWNKPDNPFQIGHSCFKPLGDFLATC